jgi:hypothetical protein
MRLALGLALACAPLLAQNFQNLATTDDGARLYFSSTSPLAGSGESPFARIFVFGPQELHVFAQQDASSLRWPSVSAKSDIVAFTGDAQANLALGNGAVFWTGSGRGIVSRNARFALFASDQSARIVELGGPGSYSATLDATVWTHAGIAADGTAAVPGAGSIQILRASGVTQYPTPGMPVSAVIDDNATTVAYEAQGRIILLDLATGAETVGADPGVQPRLSNDGKVLLYLAPDAKGTQHAWIGARQITAGDAGISEATLSGDGAVAYAVAGSVRVLRIDVASGQVEDLTAAITKAAPERPRVISMTATAGQICYQVANATTIQIQPGIGAVTAPAACLTARPAVTTTYTLTAANDAGAVTASATLEVASVAITTFTSDPSYSPAAGGPVTLSWTTQNAMSVGITGSGLPPGPYPVNGSLVVRPVTNTNYTLIAYGANGQAVSSVLYLFVR